MNVSEKDNSLDFDLAREVAKYFRMSDAKATGIIRHTKKIVAKWPQIAAQYKISSKQQEQMAAAFELSKG